jgi:Inner membrane protein YgaP-like, transmembrane domain
MDLESGGALVQGIMTLIFVAIAYWVSLPVGLALLVFMGVMRIQESVTGWCPSHLILRPMGLKKKGDVR